MLTFETSESQKKIITQTKQEETFYFLQKEHFSLIRCLTYRNIKVMKLFTGVELVRVVKLVRWQEFAKKFAVDIREGSHIVGKT